MPGLHRLELIHTTAGIGGPKRVAATNVTLRSSAGELPHSQFAERAFARAAGSEPIGGNAVRLLLDARENYPAWLAAIRDARHSILFESYIFDDDEVGRAVRRRACGEGARRRRGARRLRLAGHAPRADRCARRSTEAGAEVRVFNPPRFDSPLGWLVAEPSQDDRRSTGTSASYRVFASARNGTGDPARANGAVARHRRRDPRSRRHGADARVRRSVARVRRRRPADRAVHRDG